MSRSVFATALLFPLLVGCFGADPAHTAHFPESDGNKPEVFELSSVQVCESPEVALSRAAEFATRIGMLPYKISAPGDRVLATYTLGEPMKAHLMIERLYKRSTTRVGISTFGGYPTDVVLMARKYDFCNSH